MKVGITGGNGFLGNYVCAEVIKQGWEPIIITRSKKHINNIETDYTYERLVKDLQGLDAVVHLAADRSSSSKIEEYQSLEVITQSLYDACVVNGISNIIFASTISVYSFANNLPWKETEVPIPLSIYGISKLSIELLGQYYNYKHKLNIKNLRFAHLFGFNEKNNYMINLFMRQAFNGKVLQLDTKSSAKREFLYAKDAAKSIIIALKKESLTGSFNIGSENVLNNEEVADFINISFSNIIENKMILNPDENDSSDSSYMYHASYNDIGFIAEYSFEDALKEIYTEMEGLDNVPIYY